MKKFVQFRLLTVLAFALLFAVSVMAQEKKQVVFVWDGGKLTEEGVHPSQSTAELIENDLDFTVTILPATNINNYTQEQMDLLNNADLVILDRGIGSFNWNADTPESRPLWNTVTTPILSMNMYAVRGNNLGWVETNTVTGFGSSTEPIMAKVLKPEDPIFAGVTLDADKMFAIWAGSTPELVEIDTEDPASGEHVIVMEREGEELPLTIMSRFAAKKPFHGGENATTPAGPRTLFAMGRDSGGVAPFNYFNYTDEGKKVFLAEVKRMAELIGDDDTNVGTIAAISASVFPNPATNKLAVRMNNLKQVQIMDLTGKLILSLESNGHEVNFDISNLNAGIYLIKAFDNNNNTVVRKVVKN